MEIFVDRMREEKEQLKERLLKDIEFTSTNKFEELTFTEKHLLKQQIRHMHAYYNCLKERIDYYEKTKRN